MIKLVLLRHGESIWNKENLFTGWTDVDLSDQKVEARQAGELLKAEEGTRLTSRSRSVLKAEGDPHSFGSRLDELDLMWIPVEHSWRLNERHYGAAARLEQGSNRGQVWGRPGVGLASQLRPSRRRPSKNQTRGYPRRRLTTLPRS